MDKFFTQEFCDRCGGSLKDGRIMSMYNNDCICMKCKEKERQRADYSDAVKADHDAIKAGNYNFLGIGFKEIQPERETYKAMKQRHQNEVNALPLAFAFSGEQLQEVLTAWNITEKEAIAGAIMPIAHGAYIRTTDKDLVSNTFKRLQEERQAAIDADTTGTGFIYQMFRTELNNHEFSYTQDVDDTLTDLGFTEADINSNPALKAGLIAAIDKINTGRDPFDE